MTVLRVPGPPSSDSVGASRAVFGPPAPLPSSVAATTPVVVAPRRPRKGQLVYVLIQPIYNAGEDYAAAFVTRVESWSTAGSCWLVNVSIVPDRPVILHWTDTRLYYQESAARRYWQGSGSRRAAYWPAREGQ